MFENLCSWVFRIESSEPAKAILLQNTTHGAGPSQREMQIYTQKTPKPTKQASHHVLPEAEGACVQLCHVQASKNKWEQSLQYSTSSQDSLNFRKFRSKISAAHIQGIQCFLFPRVQNQLCIRIGGPALWHTSRISHLLGQIYVMVQEEATLLMLLKQSLLWWKTQRIQAMWLASLTDSTSHPAVPAAAWGSILRLISKLTQSPQLTTLVLHFWQTV